MRISTPVWLFLAVAATLIPWTTPLAQPVCDPGGPYAGFVGEPIQFDGTGSHSPGGTIVSYEWSFGDGATGTGPMPQHLYTAPDLYIITLIVTDDDNAVSSCETTADVFTETGTPTCDANGPYFGAVGEPILFDGTGSYSPGGTIVSYEWSFGDGATGTGPTPQHTYTVEGVYIVALTVTDDQNATSSCETSADINPLPVEAVTWGRIKAIYR